GGGEVRSRGEGRARGDAPGAAGAAPGGRLAAGHPGAWGRVVDPRSWWHAGARAQDPTALTGIGRANRAMRAGGALVCVLVASRSVLAAHVWEGPGGGLVFVLAVSPAEPRTIYAGTGRGGIFVSADAGKTWRRLTRTRRPQRVRGLAVDRAGTL